MVFEISEELLHEGLNESVTYTEPLLDSMYQIPYVDTVAAFAVGAIIFYWLYRHPKEPSPNLLMKYSDQSLKEKVRET
ncbi:MAG: hypothetical protein GQ477_03705 [Nanohaloarchaea archaeon]|nr:hypothetical protein [Candidatus Nanohaloarchaea archaeon]